MYKPILWSLLFLFISADLSVPGDKLLSDSDLEYIGAFRVPKTDMGGPEHQGLAYGGSSIAYNPINNSLFIVGHDHNQQVAEISIPNIIKSNNISDLETADVIQNLVDITEGNLLNLASDGRAIEGRAKIGGLLVFNNSLIGSVYSYYDASHVAVKSHFISGLLLAVPNDFKGMFEVGDKPIPVPQAGFIAGYMTRIPPCWQKQLGGKILTGMSALSIIGRTSLGPAAFSFNPDDLVKSKPAPSYALLYYPKDHATIGNYDSSKTLFNMGSHYSGVVFPSGTRTILYTGTQGTGDSCYGPGTNIESENGNRYNNSPPHNTCMREIMTDTKHPCCYDPVSLAKGSHAYPYADYVWAYDAKDFLRVLYGRTIADDPSPNLVDKTSASSSETYKPWHIKPYGHWEIKYPFQQKGYTLFSGASAYDENTRRLYIVQVQTDNDVFPVIHVFKLNIL